MQVLTSSCQILDSAGFNKQLPALQCTLYTYVTLFTPTNTNGFWVSARLLGDLDYKGGGLLERTYSNIHILGRDKLGGVQVNIKLIARYCTCLSRYISTRIIMYLKSPSLV